MNKHLRAILHGPQIPMAGKKGITGETAGVLRIQDIPVLTIVLDPIIDKAPDTPHLAVICEAPVVSCKVAGMKTSDTLLELSVALQQMAIQLRRKSYELLEEGR